MRLRSLDSSKVNIVSVFSDSKRCAPELRCSGLDWYGFGDFCYKPFEDKQTWHDAQDTCRTLGAELVSVLSMTEQSWLESYLYLGTELAKKNKGLKANIKYTGIDLVVTQSACRPPREREYKGST